MGTALTGLEIKDTYDSLIKVTDNGPLSATGKYLSDGLGNDSVLALSTASVGVGTTSPNIGTWNRALTLNTASGNAAYELAVAGAAQLYLAVDSTNAYLQVANASSPLSIYTGAAERMRITSAGNVGIGTSTPNAKLDVGYVAGGVSFRVQRDINNILDFYQGGGISYIDSSPSGGQIAFSTVGVERARITANGLTFNGDTAAANALDDYEEGTFTPTIIGTTTAGTATYGGGQIGTYTKIGRMVYFSVYLGYSGGTGTGNLRIAGLPFTISSSEIPSFSIGRFSNVALTALNVPIAGGIDNTTQIQIVQTPTGGGAQTSVPYDDEAIIAISGFYQV